MSCILVIHQRSDIRLSLALVLSGKGYQVIEASDVNQARTILTSHEIDLVIIDIDKCVHAAEAKSMWSFTADLKAAKADTRLIAITNWQHKELVDKASQQGVDDFLTKPWKNQQVTQSVYQQLDQANQLAKYKKLHDHFKNSESDYYAWQSHSMQKILRQINSLNVKLPFYVLSGEVSTGKKTLAKYIHQKALREKEPFISLNCVTSDQNNQSEIWLEPMEFIGNGTLVLKNIEKLSVEQQEKLVNYLLEKQKAEKNEGCLALICHQKLSDLAKAKIISPNLYKLLKINEINLPPLKQRKEDIVPFVRFMLLQSTAQHSELITLSDDAEQTLQQHHWPLNIKELALVVDKIIALAQEHITSTDLSLNILNTGSQASAENISLPMVTLEQAEIALLKQALQVTNNNTPKAAELLGLTKSSMYRRVEKYALAKK